MSAITEQPTRALIVSPNNNLDLDVPSGVGAILWIGNGGNVSCITEGGDNVTFTNVPSGTILPVKVKRVFTATTATSLLYLF
jgi:hypothetical protein